MNYKYNTESDKMNRKAMRSCNRWDSDRLPRTWHATSKCLLHVNKCHCDFDAKTQRLRHLLSSDLQTVCMCFIRKKHMSISHISLLHREHWVWQNQYRCNGWIPITCQWAYKWLSRQHVNVAGQEPRCQKHTHSAAILFVPTRELEVRGPHRTGRKMFHNRWNCCWVDSSWRSSGVSMI